jgi:electron transfer flavoprotein alpha subunit
LASTAPNGKGTAGAAKPRGDVWVFIEKTGDGVAEVSLELVGKARELADRLRTNVGAVLIGAGSEPLTGSLIAAGADIVHLADEPELADYTAAPFARVIVDLVREHAPQIVLFGATTTGRDVAPRVASALRTGLTADCTDLQIGSHSTREKSWDDLLLQIRPAFGGNIIATIVSPEHRPQMATVREGVMKMATPDPARKGEIVKAACAFGDGDFAVKVIRRVQEEKSVDLKGARVVVSGGAGVGSLANFALVHELARGLGGVVGASRAAVDAGWIGHDHQVGQTGTTVRPKLYVAVGISGSVQHRAGMDQSARILAINTDPLAPIFSVAHYGVIADLNEVIPQMIKAYKAKGGPA